MQLPILIELKHGDTRFCINASYITQISLHEVAGKPTLTQINLAENSTVYADDTMDFIRKRIEELTRASIRLYARELALNLDLDNLVRFIKK